MAYWQFQLNINSLGTLPDAASVLCSSPSTLTHSFHSNFLPDLHSLLMNTHKKNKAKHPAAPVMTPSQLAAAGLPVPKPKAKKQTKAQRIAALEEDLHITRELLTTVHTCPLLPSRYNIDDQYHLFYCRTSLQRAVVLGQNHSCLTVMTRSQQPMTTAATRNLGVVSEAPSHKVVA